MYRTVSVVVRRAIVIVGLELLGEIVVVAGPCVVVIPVRCKVNIMSLIYSEYIIEYSRSLCSTCRLLLTQVTWGKGGWRVEGRIIRAVRVRES